MESAVPTYMRGDTIKFKVELEHNFNLGDAWAVFVRREDDSGSNRFPLALNMSQFEELRRVDTTALSTVVFELTLNRNNSLFGDYDLEAIRAVPIGVERSPQQAGIQLSTPEGVSLRVAEEPSAPAGTVTHCVLEREPNSPIRRY